MRARQLLPMLAAVALLATIPLQTTAQTPMGTAFKYQGRLTDNGSPASGDYEFMFSLWDALTDGCQVSEILTFDGVTDNPVYPGTTLDPIQVTNGLFTARLDFGSFFERVCVPPDPEPVIVGSFPGNARWLEIKVKGPGDGGFTPLAPRQEITPVPYAMSGPGAVVIVPPEPSDCCTHDCGVPPDDLGARFKAALEALPDEGGTIVIPPGEYCTQTELVLESDVNTDVTPHIIPVYAVWAYGAVVKTTGQPDISAGIKVTGLTARHSIYGLTIDHRRNALPDYGFNIEDAQHVILYDPVVRGNANLKSTYAAIRVGKTASGPGVSHWARIIRPNIVHDGRTGTAIRIEDNNNNTHVYGGHIAHVDKGVLLTGKHDNALPNAVLVNGVSFEDFEVGIHVKGKDPGYPARLLGLRIVNNRFENEKASYDSDSTVLFLDNVMQDEIAGLTRFSRAPYLAGNMVAYKPGGDYIRIESTEPVRVKSLDRNSIALAPTDTPGVCEEATEGVIIYNSRQHELCVCTYGQFEPPAYDYRWRQADGGGACINCGDGNKDPEEECDDGNDSNADECNNNCEWTYCGDGFIQDPNHDGETETCDDGYNSACGICNEDCTVRDDPPYDYGTCGDGQLCPDSGEQCDDGNPNSGDGCSSKCACENTCGNSIPEPPCEECDDGNTNPGDGCDENCQAEE